MTRWAAPLALLFWSGWLLVLGSVARIQRLPLHQRLRPYVPRPGRGATEALVARGTLSLASFRDVIGPLCQHVGSRIGALLGGVDDLERRLELLHSPLSPAEHRLRQFVGAAAAFGVASLAVTALRPPVVPAILLLVAAPALAYLLVEQHTAAAVTRRREQLLAELPVVIEQLGMLLSAGFSVNAALARLAARGGGAASADLGRVCGRLRQGLDTAAALREWATLVEVPALDRLVGILALERDAADLAHLIAAEARAVRAERHQRLIEMIERRNQQVWIPVTVAALVPGVLFLAVPFIEAIRVFTE